MSYRSDLDCKIYVGGLGNDASREELEEAFSYYGSLKNVWVARRPPGFAFVEFAHPRDAESAVRGTDGRIICGRRVRVELSNGRSRWPGGKPPPHLLGRPAPRYVSDRKDERCYECGRSGHSARECTKRRRTRSRSRSRSDRRRKPSRSESRSVSRSPRRSRSPRSPDFPRRTERTNEANGKRERKSRSTSS